LCLESLVDILGKRRGVVLLTLPLWPSPSLCGLDIFAPDVSGGLFVTSSSARGCAMGRDMVALALPLMPPLSGWRLSYDFMVESKEAELAVHKSSDRTSVSW
jgi:hypothetical protein